MSIQIDRGLFKFDFIDQHAILGIPVDADIKEVRKRYLKIARRLHPDSCKAENEAEKQRASQLLSKHVNPAYEQLSSDRSNAEYRVMLNRLGKRLLSEGGKISLSGDAAKQLAKTSGNLEHIYKTSLQNLASEQYNSLDKLTDITSQISELNLVYLMRKEGQGIKRNPTPTPTPTAQHTPASAKPPTEKTEKAETQPAASRVDSYMRRAEGYMEKNNYAAAVLELREALQMEPNHPRCNTLVGVAYLRQNQPTMAKVYINKALQLNPKDETALKAKQALEKGQSTANKPDNKSGGGLFGMFGKKK